MTGSRGSGESRRVLGCGVFTGEDVGMLGLVVSNSAWPGCRAFKTSLPDRLICFQRCP